MVNILKKSVKRNAFTLVEVLAVIIIIAIVATITIPLILNVIDESKKGAFKNSAYGIVKAAELSYTKDVLSGNTKELSFTYIDGNEISSVKDRKLEYKGNKPEKGIVIVNEKGQVGLAIQSEKWCAQKSFTESEVIVLEVGSNECMFDDDNIGPIIIFEPDGSETYIKSSNVRVTVIDQILDQENLKYVWTNSEGIPVDEEYANNFENMGYIPMPNDSGEFYLHVMAKDFKGNTTKDYRKFLLDNDAPIITINGEINVTIKKGETYTDLGATAVDNIDGDVEVTVTGTVNPNILGAYIITYMAKDKVGNISTAERTVNVIDNEAPVITILGDNPTTIFVNQPYIDAGATAIDDVDGDVTNRIIITGTVNPSIAGTYTITYTVSDEAGNIATATRTVHVVDNEAPTVTFETNGNSTYAKSYSTKVTVTDVHSGVETSSLKYLWNTSTSTPSEATFTSTFTNGGTISSPSGVTGTYYLWILAKDKTGNTTITRTNVFNLDNTKPVITLNGNSTISINIGTTYTDAGATATDAHSGLNGNVTVNNPVNTNKAGTYTITYNISDKAGNAATQVTRTVVVNSITQYRYRTSYESCGTCYDYAAGTPKCYGVWSWNGSQCQSWEGYVFSFNYTYKCNGSSWVLDSMSCTGNCGSYCSSGSWSGWSQYHSTCPISSSCTSANNGATASCSSYYSATCTWYKAADEYTCPVGYSWNGSQCYRGYSCNCSTSWSGWSTWSTTPVTPTSTREVQTRQCTSWPCSTT